MITPAGPVLGILQRIDGITGRFSAPDRAEAPGTVASSQPFDPFGDAYQQAMAARTTDAPSTQQPFGYGSAVATPLFSNPSAAMVTGRYGSSPAGGLGAIAAAGAVGPAGVRSVGGYGKMPVPDRLTVAGNGHIPTEMLQPIAQRGHRLEPDAAAAWDGLVKAAAGEGLDVRITDSYRPYDQQVDLVRRKGLYSQGGLAATPGTSNHGWGLAVDADIRDPKVLSWMRTNAPRFGFVEAVPREPWHWEFRPHQV